MKKRAFRAVPLILAAIAIFGVYSCTAPTLDRSMGAAMNAEPALKARDLTPSAAIEYDTSVPAIPTPRSLESTLPAPTLILLYHNITASAYPGDYDRNVDDFRADLRFLRDSGITFINLSDIERIQSGTLVPLEGQRFAAIVIDDGFASAYSMAFPVLKEESVPATFFITTANIGEPGFMTWKQIDEIATWTPHGAERAFFEFGSHTVDHQSLAYDPEAYPDKNDYIIFLNMELNQSKTALLPHMNSKQNSIFLALPFGDASDEPEVTYAAIRMGYAGVRNSNYGAFDASDPDWNYRLPCAVMYGSSKVSSTIPLYTPYLYRTGTVHLTIR